MYTQVVTTTTFTEARRHFADTWDTVISSNKPVYLTRVGSEDVVMLSRKRYEQLVDDSGFDARRQRQLAALSQVAGSAGGIFPKGFARALKDDWPE